jgi:hypothetical protein
MVTFGVSSSLVEDSDNPLEDRGDYLLKPNTQPDYLDLQASTLLSVGGYPKNSDGSPNTRERVLHTFKHRVNESPGQWHKFQKSESVYTCPRAPFYRKTKGVLHS